MSPSRERIDRVLVARGLVATRTRARTLIEQHKVRVAGELVRRASDLVTADADITLEEDDGYVSRGAHKLEGALADLDVTAQGLVVADIGASTGGFTQCALRHGALRVYAIDVGHGQLHASLANDPRILSLEGVNARELTAQSLPELVDLVLVDASFISLVKLLPALVTLLRAQGQLLALVKPQFEVGREHVGKRGVVHDDALRNQALRNVSEAAATLGLRLFAHADCRLPGPEGNREIFALFGKA